MSLQLRRGTTSEINGFTPDEGEPLYNITDKTLVVGDGITVGGVTIGTATEAADLSDFDINYYPSVQVTSVQGDGSTVTLTTNNPHGYLLNDEVYIELNDTNLPVGQYTVTSVIDISNFTIAFAINQPPTVENGGYTRPIGYNIDDAALLQWSAAANAWVPVTIAGLGQKEYSLSAEASSAWRWSGPGFVGTEDNPAFYVTRGETYVLENTEVGHPFQIQSTSGLGGTLYTDGITGTQPAAAATLVWEVRMDAPDTLYYQCTAHGAMGGTINVR